MSIFQYHPSRVVHYSDQRAREAVEAQERERAAAQSDKSSLAPRPAESRPAPAPRIDPSNPSDPWLQATAEPGPAPAEKPAGQPGTSPKDRLSPAVYNAVEFLSEALADGQPHSASALLAKAAKQGISKDALLRARKAIHVQTERVKDGWVWSLPKDD